MGTHTYGVCCYKSVITKRKDSPLWEWKRFITRLKKKNCTILVKSKTRKRLWLQAYYLITLILWFLDPT